MASNTSAPSAWPGFSFHLHGLAFPSISLAWLSLSIRMGWLNLPSISMAWLSLPPAWPGFPFHQHGLAFFPSISMAWLSSLPSTWPGFLSLPSTWPSFLSLPSAWPGFPFHQLGLAFPSFIPSKSPLAPVSSFLPVDAFLLSAVLFRVLMRSEKVLKVGCNHLISTSIRLKPMASYQSIWCWVASDYAHNYPRVEQFAVRFQVSQCPFRLRGPF